MKILDPSERQTLQETLLAFLEVTHVKSADRVRADEHKMWAIMVLLRTQGDPNLVDWTVEQMKTYPIVPFNYQNMAYVALTGGSPATMEELIPTFVSKGEFTTAGKLAEAAGRSLTPEEVRKIGKAYTNGACRSEDSLNAIRELHANVIGAEGVAEFNKLDAEQKERFDIPD